MKINVNCQELSEETCIRIARELKSAQELSKLSEHPSSAVRSEVAENTSTSKETLDELYKHSDYNQKCLIAGNTSTSEETLDNLADTPSHHSQYQVQRTLAYNSSTSKETLRRLFRYVTWRDDR